MLGWKEIVQNYVTRHTNLIRKTTQPLRDHFGIEYFTYHRINNAGKYTVLVDRPEWAEHYVNEKIFLTDPFLRHPSVYQSGITLIENHGSDEYKETVLRSGKKVLKMDTMAVLIQKSDNHVEFFGFSGNKKTSSLQNLMLNHTPLLNSFATHFKEELKPILTQMEPEAGSLIHLKGEDFFCNEVIRPEYKRSTLLAFYKDLGIKCEAEKVEKLSKREIQCIKMFLDGKSSKETAAILGLSTRTIEHYFENIKNKLDCWSKQEVLKIAQNLVELGLF